MPLFLTDEEYSQRGNDPVFILEKADEYIKLISTQLETVKAQADASSITAEQTCSLIEQKYLSLTSEYANLQSQNAKLNASIEERLAELAQVKANKHQLSLTLIGKDGDIERLKTEASENQKSRRQLMELLAHKDSEISEKNATIQSYLDKIVNLTENSASREARLNELATELARSQSLRSRFSQEKELIERHNVWLNEELTAKVDSIIDLRKKHNELEAEMSSKLVDVERQFNECSSSLRWHKERVKELETKLTSLQEELFATKDAAATNEERLSAEISTVNKLAELYRESSEEWSKKSGELEGVIKALETHLSQVENDYKMKLEQQVTTQSELEKEVAELKEKLAKREAEIEASRKGDELNLLQLNLFTPHTMIDSSHGDIMADDNSMLVPKIPAGVSGTALAASLLRDGWSLAKMYCKYQEAVDALRHEQLGRKNSEAILQRVLYELEEKAEAIMDERAEHERMVEAYSMINEKLQHSETELTNLEKTIQELKAELRRKERDDARSQKEISDLEKQVTVLLKECQDIQLRCGSTGHQYADDRITVSATGINAASDAETVISERLLTFKDINGLVEQNVQLRSIMRNLSEQVENKDAELKDKFEIEIKKHTDEAASKVSAVLQRAEEQVQMIEALHTSVAMYKRLYEEEQKRHASSSLSGDVTPENGRKHFLLEDSHEASKKAQEQYSERVKALEEDLSTARIELISIRNERDKMALEANFAQERLESFMKEFEHQRAESNGILARNIEFSQIIVDYQRKLRESSESLNSAEEISRKLTMEVSILKHEKEMLSNAEKRAYDEVRRLSERVHTLQASLDTIQNVQEVREESRAVERRKQEERVKQTEMDWAEAKKELQQERDKVRSLTLDREETMKNAMRQVEEIGKQLSNAMHAASTAEARAAVAEARYSDLEKKIKTPDHKLMDMDRSGAPSFSSEVVTDLNALRKELDTLREEAQVSKDHMLQYKSIAQVNEAALRQMENAHANFKIEAENLKNSLEAEILSLRERISELETEASLKAKELASEASDKDEALGSAFFEIRRLKEECSSKISQIVNMEVRVSSLSEDLEKEHQRWRTAQANYERQVILQSETIQELTKTSEALSALQEETSELRRVSNTLKNENNELKAKLEAETTMLEESKIEVEKKYNEINEQNKILHSHLEALHIQLAERDRKSAGMSESSVSDPSGDAGLQSVIGYLRRSKEIAETEISLLKQEKLRLQSQLESALKAADNAQTSLHAERANLRAMLLSEEEIKSLQLQVREMSLLRESNIQLREENKQNFEEWQKLRELAQKGRVEMENLEKKLREKEIEVEACKKEIEMQRMEKDLLTKQITELVERCNNVDVEDYKRTKEEVQQLQKSQKELESQVEAINKLVLEKQEIISKLEHELANRNLELLEREQKMNELMQVENNSKLELEKHKRVFKRKFDSISREKEMLSKEKDDLSKENQALSKQLEDSKQAKRSSGDVTGEQAMKDKILEKTVERLREEVKKGKEENQAEKAKRQKLEKQITESVVRVNQDKTKFLDELEKHKQELENFKHTKGFLPEDKYAAQLVSGKLEDHAASYVASIENLEKVAQSDLSDVGVNAVPAETSTSAGPPVLSQASSGFSFPAPTGARSPTKVTEENEKRLAAARSQIESRKPARKLVRSRLGKPEEPQGDAEMAEAEGTTSVGKLARSQDTENVAPQALPRKRHASPSPELTEDSAQGVGEVVSDAGAHTSKKSKGSESEQEGAERHHVVAEGDVEILPATEESAGAAGDLHQGSNDEVLDADKGEQEEFEQESKDPAQVDIRDEMISIVQDTPDRPSEKEAITDDISKEQLVQGLQPSLENEKEEGELDTDTGDVESSGFMSTLVGSPGTGEGQIEPEGNIPSSPMRINDYLAAPGMDFMEVNSPEILNDEKNDEGDIPEETTEGLDKSNDSNEQIGIEAGEIPSSSSTVEETNVSKQKSTVEETNGSKQSSTVEETNGSKQSSTVEETNVSKQSASSTTVDDVKQILPASSGTSNLNEAGSSSRTINLNESARKNARLRQQGLPAAPIPAIRGRGRPAARGRGVRGRPRGRGQSPGDQL